MMEMANDQPTPKWRNFAAWSAATAIVYVPTVWGLSSLLHEDGMGAMFRSTEVVAKVGLALIFSMAFVGFTSQKRPLSLRTFRNFVTLSALAVVACLLVLWGFRAFVGARALGASEWVAAVVGVALVMFAFVGILNVAIAYRGGQFMEADTADELRERGRLFLYSFVWMAACGVLLVVLGLAGPGGMLSPAAALAGALVLIAFLTVLWIATWRLSDELMRTLSYETGTMAFYLILVFGGGWAMLAHLGFVAGPAPLDWLTMFIVLIFVASIVATGRRKLLTR